MKRLHQIIAPIAFSTLAFGCGLGGNDSGGSAPVAEADVVAAYAAAVCGLIFDSCDCAAPSYTDKDACIASFEMSYGDEQVAAMMAGLTYDASCGGQWVGDAQSLGCGTEYSSGSCSSSCSIYSGSVAAGQPCSSAGFFSDCLPGLACDFQTSICVDPCEGLEDYLQEGDACLDAMGEPLGACDYESLMCDVETSVCIALPLLGEPCPGSQCAGGSVCDYETDPVNPVCIAAPGIGEPCPSGQCASGAQCDFDTDPVMPVCVAVEAIICSY